MRSFSVTMPCDNRIWPTARLAFLNRQRLCKITRFKRAHLDQTLSSGERDRPARPLYCERGISTSTSPPVPTGCCPACSAPWRSIADLPAISVPTHPIQLSKIVGKSS